MTTSLQPKISIIGGGLSAIYSYFGCLDAGYQPPDIEVVYSNRANPIGAVFMYETPFPWPVTNVVSVLMGTPDQYSMNQWGQVKKTSAHKRFTQSPAVVEQLFIYEEMKTTLWGMIPNKMESPMLSDSYISDLKKRRKAVIATFANPERKREYTANHYVIPLPVYTNKITTDKHIVLYNGLSDVPWVRQTISMGKIFVEYPSHYSDNPTFIMMNEASRDNKGGEFNIISDLHPNCPDLEWNERIEDNLFRVGRFAAFMPGYLSHQARQETARFLNYI